MRNAIKKLLVPLVLGIALLVPSTSAKADHNPYWRGYWGWYDNTYRPYYHQYYGPTYSGYYGGGYYGRPYYGGGYYASPRGYYAAPGVNVRVGRMNFGWW